MPLCWVFSFISLILISLMLSLLYGGPLSVSAGGGYNSKLLTKWFW